MTTSALPEFSKALKLNSTDQPATVETLPTPRAGPGSVIVRVLASMLVAYSREVYNGSRAHPLPTPFTPGAAAICRIAEVGPDTTTLSVGQLVLFDNTIRGRDSPSAIYLSDMMEGFTPEAQRLSRGEWRNSTFAEHAKVPLENCLPLDEKRLLGRPADGGLGYTPDDLAQLFLLAVPYGGLRDIDLKAGETVAVAPATGKFGAAAAVRAALAMGARVVAVGRDREVLAGLEALAPGNRVSAVRITGDAAGDAAGILRANGGRPVDAVLDISPPAAAQSSHFASWMSALAFGGRVSLMGGVERGDVAFDYRDIGMKAATLRFTWMCTREQALALIRMVEAGALPLGEAAGLKVVGKFELDEFQTALERAARYGGPGEAVVINP